MTRRRLPAWLRVAPLGAWSLKSRLALGSGLLMLVFSMVFTLWSLRMAEADLRRGGRIRPGPARRGGPRRPCL